MIITQERTKVVQSHNFDQVNCTIDAEDMRYVASLLRNNYSNTRLAVVREISANALDANAEANVTRPIEIKLPTAMNPTFAVRDFGGGLSQEDVFGLYSKYGKSTKRTSNNYIGAFGIGKFAPLSYGENFTCVSYHNGLKTSYNVFVNEDDDTKIVKLHEEPSAEPTGLSIEVAVADDDRNEFREVARKFFRFFSSEDMPKFIGVEEDFIQTPKKVLSSKTDEWFFVDDSSRGYGYGHYYSHVLMGRVSYPIDPNAINVDNFVSDENSRRIINQLLQQNNFYFRMPLGSVRLHHSREALEYNKTTQKEICAILFKVSKDIQTMAKEKLADSEDLWEAKKNYAQVVNALPYQVRNVFENSFEWNGMKIQCSSFQRDYQLQDDLILTEYSKEEDKNARNGFKVKPIKTNRIHCQDNFLFMIQDIDSSHGNNLRVRTLMNEDSELQGVYVINAINGSAKSEVYDNWQFGLVDKKHIRYSSQVDKEKIVRNKVSGTSRASIPLFTMRTDTSYIYRNADYWKSLTDPIDSLDIDNVEGSVNGKLIYVPIKNYKVDIEDFDLDRVSKICTSIRKQAKDNSQEKDLVLFGVRAGDVKKLDEDVWMPFTDFYLDICKKMIRKNKKDCQSAYKIIQFKNFTDRDFESYRWNYGQMFTNNTFNVDSLGEDHLLSRCAENWKLLMEEDTIDRKFRVAINVVKIYDEQWLNDVLDVNVDADSIMADFKLLSKKYPLLKIVANTINKWMDLNRNSDYENNNTNENIVEYISLCDGVGA